MCIHAHAHVCTCTRTRPCTCASMHPLTGGPRVLVHVYGLRDGRQSLGRSHRRRARRDSAHGKLKAGALDNSYSFPWVY